MLSLSLLMISVLLLISSGLLAFGACLAQVQMYDPMPAYVTSSFPVQPDAGKRRNIVNILASINYAGPNVPIGAICTKAFEVALDRLRGQQKWLLDYELRFELIDDICEDTAAIVLPVIQLNRNSDAFNRVPLMITSPCANAGQTTIGALLKNFNFLGLVQDENSPEMEKRRHWFSSSLTMGSIAIQRYAAMADFMVAMGWRKIAIISEVYDYFDAMERYLGPILEGRNLTLSWMGKVTYMSQNEEEMSNAFIEMKKRDPRVILSNTNSPISVSCWLHRFGMYGPNYAIFYQHWSYFEAERITIAPHLAKWCTTEMLLKVSDSGFFFGDSNLADLSGNPDSVIDSTGLSYTAFLNTLKEKINSPDTTPFWPYWRNLCYDQALFSGYFLNQTEFLLQKRNESLIDWVTSGENFSTQPDVFMGIMREALVTMDMVKGFKGEYKFSRADDNVNSLGFAPGTIEQRLPDPKTGARTKQVAAYFKNNERLFSLVIMPGYPKWRTKDGQPPSDSIYIVDVNQLTMSAYEHATLSTIALLEIVLACLQLGIVFGKGKLSKLPRIVGTRLETNFALFGFEDFVTNFGNIIMLFHIPVLMTQESSLKAAGTCTASAFFVTIGFTISTSGIWNRLFSRRYRNSCRFLKTSSVGCTIIILLWMSLQVSLLVPWMVLDPIPNVIVKGSIEASGTNSSLAYRSIRNECELSVKTPAANGLMATMMALQIILLIHCAILAFELSQAKLDLDFQDLGLRKKYATGVYCILLVIAAGILIAVIGASSGRYIQLTVACITLVYCGVVSCFFSIGKLLHVPNAYCPVSAAAGTVGTIGTSHQAATKKQTAMYQMSSQTPVSARKTPATAAAAGFGTPNYAVLVKKTAMCPVVKSQTPILARKTLDVPIPRKSSL